MYSPFGCRYGALLPRVYTCRCQTLLRISWRVQKCPAALHQTPIHQTKVLAAGELIHQSISLSLEWSLDSFAEDTYLFSLLLCLMEPPSHLTDRWTSFEVAPSHLQMWRPENEPPPQDPIKAKPRVHGLDIHRQGNLYHQHILCHVRMITAY